MVHHEVEAAPTTHLVLAAVALVEEWAEMRRRQASTTGTTSVVRPVFDYSVSLAVWRERFGITRAGRESANELLPLRMQTLLVGVQPFGLSNVGFPSEVTVHLAHQEEHLTLKYDVKETHATLALHAPQSYNECHEVDGRRLSTPLTILSRPILLLRIFDHLFEVPFVLHHDPHADAHRLIEEHLKQLPSSTSEPNAPVPLAILLRDLRIVFECDYEVEELNEQVHAQAGVRRQQHVTTLRLDAHAAAPAFIDLDEWEALVHRLRTVPGINNWIETVQHGGMMHKLGLFLRDQQVAHAHAAMELGWERIDNTAFTRRIGRTASEDREAEVNALAERNIAAWHTAMEHFENLFDLVANESDGEESLAKHASPAHAFQPVPRRQF